MSFILPQNETERLAALKSYDILGSAPEAAFDDLARLAANICAAPTALISLTDENRQWFKSRGNLEICEAARDIAFSAYTIRNPAEVLIVEDATKDPRFSNNPSVTGEPHVRFYAGAPLVSPDGFALGSLCVVDYKPRSISAEQIESLKMLARQVVAQMELRRDIAEREKSRQKLAASEQRFRDFVDNSLGLFCTHDLDGNVLSVNPAGAASLGYAENEIVGEHLNKFLVPEAIPYTKKYLKNIKSARQSHGFMWILTKSGERRIWAHNNVLRVDGDGREYVLGSAQDITDLKRNEEELTKNRQMFESFMNHSPAVIFLKDSDGNFVYVNEPFEQLMKVRFEDLRGKNELVFTTKEIAGALRANDLLVLETEEQLQTIEIVPTPDGVTHYWLSHKFLIKDERGEKLVGGISVDITDRRRMEIELRRARDAALESARLKSAFLTNVSHEIRTPMNGVVGMTELLLDTPLDRAQRECAETIRQSADALLTIINDILDIAKIESGKLRFETVGFDVRETIESTIELLAARAFGKNNEIASLVAEDVPAVLRGDPGRLRQVLTNLIGNAVKFTEQGEIGVFVRIERDNERGVCLRFTVTDTGIGIAQQDIKNLFQPFVQADSSTTRQFGGTGLGLAISKQIVEMMNGEITVESEPGRGSRFSFTASFLKNDAASQDAASGVEKQISAFENSPSQTEASATELLKGKRLLIADSSRIIRRTLKQYAAVWRLAPVEAASGEETLRLLGEAERAGQPFDAVLMDMNLPDWEGFALTQRIKSDDAFQHARVILTTAYGQRGDAARAQAIGVAGYLTKPIRSAQFFECLVAVFGEETGARGKNDFIAKGGALVTRHSLREAKSKIDLQPVLFDEKTFPILVVEDNEINRRLLLRQLEQIGARADTAVDGVDALEKMEAKNYQFVFMDCQMPRLDGYAATREIRRVERENKTSAPACIIALTAHTLAGEREKCLAAGMNDYLSKPIKIKEVAAMLEFWNQSAKAQAGENVETDTVKESFPPESHHAKFDPQTLRDLAAGDGDPNFAQEIFNLYLEETDARLGELENAARSNDAQSAARIAHALRGNSLAVGAGSVASIAARIEQACRENDHAKINLLSSELAREFAAIQTEMLELCEKW